MGVAEVLIEYGSSTAPAGLHAIAFPVPVPELLKLIDSPLHITVSFPSSTSGASRTIRFF